MEKISHLYTKRIKVEVKVEKKEWIKKERPPKIIRIKTKQDQNRNQNRSRSQNRLTMRMTKIRERIETRIEKKEGEGEVAVAVAAPKGNSCQQLWCDLTTSACPLYSLLKVSRYNKLYTALLCSTLLYSILFNPTLLYPSPFYSSIAEQYSNYVMH